MGKQTSWLLLGILALCAIACYAAGFIIGAIVLISIGAIFELLFWLGVFGQFKK